MIIKDIGGVSEAEIPALIEYAEKRTAEKSHTKSIDMSDEQIRVYIIKNVFIKYDRNIYTYLGVEAEYTLSGSKLYFKLITVKTDMDKEINNLTLTTGEYNTEIIRNQAEFERVSDLVDDTDKMTETYETNRAFFWHRFFKSIKGITLAGKIAVGAGVVIASVFGLFVAYNFLKSYGTVKGKQIALKSGTPKGKVISKALEQTQ